MSLRGANLTATERKPELVARVRGRLDGLLSPDWWHIVLAFLSGLLTYIVTTGGLFILVPWVQSAIIAGIAVGLLSPKLKASALTGALAGLLGSMYGPENFYNNLFSFTPEPPGLSVVVVIGSMILCAAIAAGVVLLRSRFEGATTALVAVAILMLIVNLWFTPVTLNAVSSMTSGDEPMNAFNEQLDGEIPDALSQADGTLFLFVHLEMRDGLGFYDAYAKVIDTLRGGTSSVADFRLPTVFWLWSALPNPQSIPIAYLVLVTLAVLSVIPLGINTVKAPLLIPGVAALTSYLAYFSFNLELLRQDPWAAVIAVIALSAYAASVRSSKWRAWTCATVALAVLSLLVRETMAFLLIAGFVSALFGDKSQRRFRITAWTVGGIVFAALFGLHAMTAQPFIVQTADVPRAGYGSLSFMLIALDYATSFLGRHGWLPMALGAIGISGALMIRDRRLRAFALISTVGPLLTFLVLGNNAFSGVPGGARTSQNYWGVAVVPLLYALIPYAFSFIPRSVVEIAEGGAGAAADVTEGDAGTATEIATPADADTTEPAPET